MRKCLSHFGQTLRLSSRSFFQIIWWHSSHFTHSPSVRTLFSPEVSNSPDCRLNQVIRSSSQFSAKPALLRTENRELPLRTSIRFLSAPSRLSHKRASLGAFQSRCRQARQLSDARFFPSR